MPEADACGPVRCKEDHMLHRGLPPASQEWIRLGSPDRFLHTVYILRSSIIGTMYRIYVKVPCQVPVDH